MSNDFALFGKLYLDCTIHRVTLYNGLLYIYGKIDFQIPDFLSEKISPHLLYVDITETIGFY